MEVYVIYPNKKLIGLEVVKFFSISYHLDLIIKIWNGIDNTYAICLFNAEKLKVYAVVTWWWQK